MAVRIEETISTFLLQVVAQPYCSYLQSRVLGSTPGFACSCVGKEIYARIAEVTHGKL